jgi:Family of unknown function (DUF6092)
LTIAEPVQEGSMPDVKAKSGSTGGVLTEEQALELIAYLASAAEISLAEPTHYPTFRLIDATSRLIGFMVEHETPRTGAFLRAFKEEVDRKKVWMMWDAEAYFDFLRSAPALVAAEVRRLAEGESAGDEEATA